MSAPSMKLRTLGSLVLAVLLTAVAVGPAYPAGPKGYRCPVDTQTCLNQMVAKLKKRAWLGIEYDDSRGSDKLRITRVVPASPAAAAGFEVGDILVSINGAKFADNDEDRCVTCEKTESVWKPGSTVEYVVLRDDKQIRLSPTLTEMPPDIMAMMIGLHMIEHAQEEHE